VSVLQSYILVIVSVIKSYILVIVSVIKSYILVIVSVIKSYILVIVQVQGPILEIYSNKERLERRLEIWRENRGSRIEDK